MTRRVRTAGSLDPRSQSILRAVIEEYVDSATPDPDRLIAWGDQFLQDLDNTPVEEVVDPVSRAAVQFVNNADYATSMRTFRASAASRVNRASSNTRSHCRYTSGAARSPKGTSVPGMAPAPARLSAPP